jgi:UDP-N-acetylmuramoylalanine--D-glutamate ligase
MLIGVDEIRIRGPHNLYNSMAAALSARSLEVASSVIRESLMTFPGVPHRLEPVRELDGVRYINDSKATNVDSLWYALSSFTEPVVLIGDAADEMEEAFSGVTKTVRAGHDMREAVAIARSIAVAGDVVLLSPACASFDMFDNYEHRGDVFKSLVNELESAGARRVDA